MEFEVLLSALSACPFVGIPLLTRADWSDIFTFRTDFFQPNHLIMDDRHVLPFS